MEEPDITDILFQSIEHTFATHFPNADIELSAQEDPDALIVKVVTPLSHTYTMKMTDDWQSQDHFRFTFTSTTDPTDTITVDLEQP